MKKIIGILFLMIVMLTTISIAAYPEELEKAENYDGLIELHSDELMIPEYAIIEDDVYQIEEKVVINQIIDGNVYVMAKELEIKEAIIYGNLYVIAEKIEIENSEIRGSVYVIGESIDLSGMINDLYAIGNNVTFGEDSTIWRSARIVAEGLNIRGNIGRDLYASVENINIADNAKIDGKVKYFSETQGNISENAQVGEIEFVEQKEIEEENRITTTDYIMQLVKVAFRTLIIALIVIFLIRKVKNLPRENTVPEFFKLIGKGIGVLIVVPVLSVLLMISMIGTALGVSLLAIYIVLVYFATAIFAVEMAYRIEKENKAKIIGIAVLIAVILKAITWIPTIGGMIQFIALLIGLGILFNMIFKRIKNETNNGEINEN